MMCKGTAIGFPLRKAPHRMGRNYGLCFACGEYLGCSQCAGPPQEVLCRKCAVWGTPEALAEHGPISNRSSMILKRGGVVAPPLDAYPGEWR